MTAAAVDPPWSRDELLAAWQELDVPEGWRAEIIFDGTITVSPPPIPGHTWIGSLLTMLLAPAIPAGTSVAHQFAVRIPATEKLYEPDLAVLPKDVLKTAASGPDAWMDAGEMMLVVEITSRYNADVDRTWKRRGYATGGVPLYLLVDRWSRPAAMTLLSEPDGADYQQTVTVPFGEKLTLPEPFSIEIDTSEFTAGKG
jgi:Uma2 family endonuclease